MQNGEFGKLVPVNNSAKLSEGLLALLNGKISFENRSLIQRSQNFSVENCAKEFFNLLNEVS